MNAEDIVPKSENSFDSEESINSSENHSIEF